MRLKEAALAASMATLIWIPSPGVNAQVLATPSSASGNNKSEAAGFEAPATKTGLNFDFAVLELIQNRRCTIERRTYDGPNTSGESKVDTVVGDCPNWTKKQENDRGNFVMLTVLSSTNERKDKQTNAPTNRAQAECLLAQVQAFEAAATTKSTRDILSKLFGAKEAKFALIDNGANLVKDDSLEYGFKCGAAEAPLAIHAVINSKHECVKARTEDLTTQVQECARARFSAKQLDPLLPAKPKADPRAATRKTSAPKNAGASGTPPAPTTPAAKAAN